MQLEEAEVAAKGASKAMEFKTAQFEERARTIANLVYAFMSLVQLKNNPKKN